MISSRIARMNPGLAVCLIVGAALSVLLVGFEPVGDDPDLMYRPFKEEYARALRAGHLPYWSDQFGLGVPLVAESHVAAFYPLNLIFYRILSVPVAYRISMWLHFVALAGTMYGYARSLGQSRFGGGMAALGFSLCGFQAIHCGHEPFYTALVYLPMLLWLTRRYVESGGWAWLGGMALAWGIQITLGHFQIPFWTGCLVLLLGTHQVFAEKRPMWRLGGIVLALAWGLAVATAQLVLTWELTSVAGFNRAFEFLATFSYPPRHWSQPALPALFAGYQGGAELDYWGPLKTTSGEAGFYIGTIPLILAFVGWIGLGTGRSRGLAPWRWIIVVSLAIATMPTWSMNGFWLLTRLPGVGNFRAPARYTLLASLGMALLAGQGLDRAIAARRFMVGYCLAGLFGAAAFVWTLRWAQAADVRSYLGRETVTWRFAGTAICWMFSLAAVAGWRWWSWSPKLLLAVPTVELVLLFYLGPVHWGRPLKLPAASPMALRLSQESHVGLVAGPLRNFPARFGYIPAYPYLGITPPPPTYLLEAATIPNGSENPITRSWMRWFGVSHGIWREDTPTPGGRTVAVLDDATLNWLSPDGRPPQRWKLVVYSDPAPPVWIATRDHRAREWGDVYVSLGQSSDRDIAWYLPESYPPPPASPRATRAKVESWDGREAVVEHDGTCDLIIRRNDYPGWMARVNGAEARPILRVNGGLQAIRLSGLGPSRVETFYEPTGLRTARAVSLMAIVAALGFIGWAGWMRRKRFDPDLTP